MNLHSKKFSRFCAFIMFLSGLFPLALALALFLNPPLIPHLPILCGITGLTATLADTSKQRRILCGIIGTCVLTLYGVLVFSRPPFLLLIPFLYLLQLLFLLRPHTGTSYFHLQFFFFCLVLYGAFQFGMLTMAHGNIPWSASLPFFPIAFLLFLFTSLVLNNLDLLQVEIRFGRKVPFSVLHVSRLNIFLLLFASVVITCIPQITRFLHFLYQTLRDFIITLVQFLSSLFPSEEAMPDSAPLPGSSLFPLAESAPETPPNPILEMILNFITWTIILSLAAYLLFRIGRLLLHLFRLLVRRFQQYLSAFDTSYVDTYEDLPIPDSHRQSLFRRSKKSPVALNNTPRDRIRFTYLKKLMRHPEWSPSETASEHLCKPAAELYEKARYSTHEITGEDAANFSTLAQK